MAGGDFTSSDLVAIACYYWTQMPLAEGNKCGLSMWQLLSLHACMNFQTQFFVATMQRNVAMHTVRRSKRRQPSITVALKYCSMASTAKAELTLGMADLG
jgi:hypothetical protein